MKKLGQPTWGRGEFYETLCLLMIGACFWLISATLGAFEALTHFVLTNNLIGLLTLTSFMGVALLCAAVRKSLILRRIMRERDAAAKQSELIARHDALTGLANRRRFLEAIEHRQKEVGFAPLSAVLLIDLDRFKPVNDLYGHAAGNAVLCEMGERLRAFVPRQGIAARLGGDEFAVLLPLESGSDGLTRLANQMIASLSAPVMWQGNELKVGATLGITFVTSEHANPDAVLHAADLAMYQGKKDGRGVYRVFKSAMDEELRARAQIEIELRAAIQNGEIEPYYQPVVALPGRNLVGVEVLARWRHPTRGLLAPNHFIAIAEETGCITDLSYSLIKRACLDAREWPTHLTLAINIAPQQFKDVWLSERILAILIETGFPPHRLEVEITESALIHDLEVTRKTLTSLQNLGVRIALDDFGTGYSSLYHLRELKFDKLKIDRSYVDSVTMSDERAKLVDAIIKLGSSLGLVTTAEGIETEASSTWLSDQGCDFGQGYLFGKPMPKGEMDQVIAAPERVLIADVSKSEAA